MQDPDTAVQTRSDGRTSTIGPTIVSRAVREYDACGRRSSILGTTLSVDPAWNILLDLLIAEAADRRLSVTDACLGSRSSVTTGIRYLGLLQSEGLIERLPDRTDRRRTYVRLTAKGRRAVIGLLGEDDR